MIAFDGGHNLAIWAAQRQGFFEDNGVRVILSFTPSSTAAVTGMFDDKFDIAALAIDNVIAYQEGPGEAKIPDHRICSRSWRSTTACSAWSPRLRSTGSPTSRARRCQSTR